MFAQRFDLPDRRCLPLTPALSPYHRFFTFNDFGGEREPLEACTHLFLQTARPVLLRSKLAGLPKEDFIEYMQLFLGFKDGAGSSGSGGSSLIAGVSQAGDVIGVMSSEEFIVKYLPEFVPPQLESEVAIYQKSKAGSSPST